MKLSRYEFELLTYLENKRVVNIDYTKLVQNLLISRSKLEKVIDDLCGNSLINTENDFLKITEEGVEALEPYRVKKAIIMGAGFGSRMMPATENQPKPMVTVNGKRIIETQLDAMVEVGIKDITIVGGYKKEKYKELLEKYPFIRLVDNPDYDKTNNISSVIKVLDRVEGGLYLCEADLYISNPKVITKYQYTSNILGSYSLETDDWSFRLVDGYASDYRQGNTFCYNYYGISYWSPVDCLKLQKDWKEVYQTDEGKNIFWELVPLKLRKDNYKVEIRQCQKQDIMEIDNYFELAALDKSYR